MCARGRDHMTDLSTLCVLLYSSLFIRLIGGFSFIRSFVRSYVLFTYIDMFLLGPIFFRFFFVADFVCIIERIQRIFSIVMRTLYLLPRL